MINSSTVKQWIKWDKSDGEKISKMSEAELTKIFSGRMAFGTAGLRSTMGPGPSQMNDLTILQTCQGLIQYGIKQFGKEILSERGIVVGFDARFNSKSWSRILANVASHLGINKIYIFRDITPTPWVAFAIKHYKACLGVMITASHNPKNDNGYKVYWNTGSQIISPHDKGISNEILNNLQPLDDKCWDKINLPKSSIDCMDEITTEYMKSLKIHNKFDNSTSNLKIVYTPVHGVGHDFVKLAITETFGFKHFYATPEQYKPDPNFPTVTFPNPEEGKGVLELSFKHADKVGSNLVIASDPDADRCAIAQRKNLESPWKVFTGNELGAFLGYWAFQMWKKSKSKESLENIYMLSSTVSSMILKSMAKKEGFKFIDTLTGFKWMGSVANDLIKDGKTVLLAFEEAIGFMYGSSVLDKDGVSAAAIFSEMVSELDKDNVSLEEQLDKIYKIYGYHVISSSYFISHDKSKTNEMFEILQNNYPEKLGEYEIEGIRDLNKGYDNRQPNNKATLPTQSSHMITFYFKNGAIVTLRTSGTEPKIKYYLEIIADSKEKVIKDIEIMTDLLIKEWFQPDRFGFLWKSV